MIGHLVQQQASDEAHVGAAAFDHAHRRSRATDERGAHALDDRADRLDDHIAAGPLGKTEAFLGADDFVLLRGESGDVRARQRDHFDRDAGFIEEADRFGLGIRRLGRTLVGMGDNAALGGIRRRAGLGQREQFAQAHLLSRGEDTALLALLTEELTPEPVHLVLEAGDLLLQLPHIPLEGGPIERQLDHLLGAEAGCFIECREGLAGRGGHAVIISQAAVIYGFMAYWKDVCSAF